MRHGRFSKRMRWLALVVFLTGLTGIVPWLGQDTAHAAVTPYSARGAFLAGLGGDDVSEITFDDLTPGTDVEGETIEGVLLKTPWLGCDPYGGSAYRCGAQQSAPLIVGTGITGMPATTGTNLLSSGGTDIASCNDPSLDNDDLTLHFTRPVRAAGLDIIFESSNGSSMLGVRVLDPEGNILYEDPALPLPIPTVPGPDVRFIGFISDAAEIARIEIDEYDEDCGDAGSHVGYDSILLVTPEESDETFTFTPSTLSTGPGSAPSHVAIGDLNNDGFGDIVTANSGSDTVSVFVGDQSGGFLSPVSFYAGFGSTPTDVAIGDLNNDGFGDIVTANSGSDTVSVFVGDQSGGFLSPVSFYAGFGSTPTDIAIGDVNGDGIGDVAVAAQGTNRVLLYLQEYPPSPDTVPITLDTGAGSAPSAVSIGDFNGDGDADIAVTAPGTNRVLLYAGGSVDPGGAMPVVLYAGIGTSPGTMPVALAIGDFSGDARPDLVTANFASDSITLYRNTTEFCDGTDDDSDGETDEGFPAGDTSCGADVEVARPTSSGSVAVRFPSVNFSGDTTVTTNGTGPAAPTGRSMGSTPVWFDITTTANFTGTATVCIDYSEGNYTSESRLRLFHYKGSSWDDITTTLDTAANRICGNTTSFSPFIIASSAPTLVSQLDFSAHADGSNVALSWSTGMETDNEGFYILRSESANGPFTAITPSMIPAMGGAGMKATYTFTDSNVEIGKTYYYRLQDVDTHGKATAHQVIPVTDAVARTDGASHENSSKGNNMVSASQQADMADQKGSVEKEPHNAEEPLISVSVVVAGQEGRSAVVETNSNSRSSEDTAPFDKTETGVSSGDGGRLPGDIYPQSAILDAQSAPLTATTGVVALHTHHNPGPSSFSVSIEDGRGNIIKVSSLEDKAGASTSTSDLEVTEVTEGSDRLVIAWHGKKGVKGFILHRSEKGKDNYAPISNLIPYFGRDDKDDFLYQFTDNSAKPGVKYDYRLERVEADHKPNLKIGKLAE